jgi:hypothetical protein
MNTKQFFNDALAFILCLIGLIALCLVVSCNKPHDVEPTKTQYVKSKRWYIKFMPNVNEDTISSNTRFMYYASKGDTIYLGYSN